MASSENIIELKNVGKTYVHFKTRLSRFLGSLHSGYDKLSGKYWDKRMVKYPVLEEVSFALKRGDSLGIIGFNGSGKSTLLQMIAGTLRNTNGEIFVNGRVAALLELGSGFNPEFTGIENVYLNGALFGLSKAEITQRIPLIAEFADIGEYINNPVKTYSSGMLVRLAFSVLTQVDPDVLIVDEALAVGDMHFQHKCIQHIKDLQKRGTTLLFVSHDPAAVKAICSQAILLHSGKVYARGAASSVYDYYNALIAERDTSTGIIRKTVGEFLQTESGNKKAVITNFDLSCENVDKGNVFVTGSDVMLQVNCHARHELSSLTLGFIIRDRLGYEIFGTNSFEMGQVITKVCENEAITFLFRVKLLISPGTYTVSLSLHPQKNHYDENYHWIDNAISFRVLPSEGMLNFVGCVQLPVALNVSHEIK